MTYIFKITSGVMSYLENITLKFVIEKDYLPVGSAEPWWLFALLIKATSIK